MKTPAQASAQPSPDKLCVAERLSLPTPETVNALPLDALQPAARQLAELQLRVAERLSDIRLRGATKEQASEDRLVSAKDAAKLIGMGRDWIYKNAEGLPFTRRVGRRSLRFSLEGIRRYNARRGHI